MQIDAQQTLLLESGSNVLQLNDLIIRGASDPVYNSDVVTKAFLDTALGDI